MTDCPTTLTPRRSWLARLWSAIKPSLREYRHDHALRETIDLVVTGTDPRIRGVANYDRKLAPAVAHMLEHFTACGGWLAPAIEMSTRAWSHDPIVRALFTSSDELHRLFGQNRQLRSFFAEHPELDQAYVALTATRHERKSLGMGLNGDVLQRDIPQTMLGFSDFRVFGASVSEEKLRAHVSHRGFGFLIGEALDRIVEEHLRRHGAEDEERILSLQLKALEHKKRAVDALFDATCALDEKIKQLRDRVLRQPRAVVQQPRSMITLEDYITQINAVLGQSERYITQERVTLYVDKMNIEHESAHEGAAPIVLSEVTIGQRPPRVIILARYPRSELPQATDRLDEAVHLLGL